MVRRRLAIVTFIITAVVAANPVLLRVPFSNRRGLAAALDAAPDPRGYYPEYRAFLADVRAQTRDGDAIALIVPFRSWDEGYAHPYLRAAYLLAGRQVVPIIAPARVEVRGPLPRPQYVAIWGMPEEGVAGQTIFERHRGRLVKLP